MIRFAPINLVELATATASSEDAVYVAVNARHPERPFEPWKTTTTGIQSLVIDFGTATTLTGGSVSLIHANFTSASIQGHATNTWGAPTYNQAVTLTRAPNERYHHGHRIVGTFALRFLRILIPSQTPTDGATVYRLGGVWAGGLISPPRDIRMEPTERKHEPREDLKPGHGGWLARFQRGEPLYCLYAEQLVDNDTELAAWREVERQLADADYFLTLVRDTYLAEAFVMRRTNSPDWRHAKVWMTGSLDLEEVVR